MKARNAWSILCFYVNIYMCVRVCVCVCVCVYHTIHGQGYLDGMGEKEQKKKRGETGTGVTRIKVAQGKRQGILSLSDANKRKEESEICMMDVWHSCYVCFPYLDIR